MLISFLNDADIKTISEFKDSFGKYYPVFPKNPKNWGVKSAGFWLKFKGKKCNKRCINLSFFDLETQNLNVKSITKTVLEKSKKKNLSQVFPCGATICVKLYFNSNAEGSSDIIEWNLLTVLTVIRKL